MTTHQLRWQPLVQAVRRGLVESRGDTPGLYDFMYCESPSCFISDPYRLQQIRQARAHSHPFMVTGALETGKHVMLVLIARGAPGGSNLPCLDENIRDDQREETERFFGRGGIVDRANRALLFMDYLEHTVGWPSFLDTLIKLINEGVLRRTDGEEVPKPGIRLAGGATVNLDSVLEGHGNSLLSWVYARFHSHQHIRTTPCSSHVHRMQELLGEILAAQVLDPKAGVIEADAERLSSIDGGMFRSLQAHKWPGGFGELVAAVRAALAAGSWEAVGSMVGDTKASAHTSVAPVIGGAVGASGPAPREPEWVIERFDQWAQEGESIRPAAPERFERADGQTMSDFLSRFALVVDESEQFIYCKSSAAAEEVQLPWTTLTQKHRRFLYLLLQMFRSREELTYHSIAKEALNNSDWRATDGTEPFRNLKRSVNDLLGGLLTPYVRSEHYRMYPRGQFPYCWIYRPDQPSRLLC